MKTLNIQAAKTHLSRLVEEAVAGDDIIIAKAGKPMVKLVPVLAHHQPRKLGSLRGKIWMSADCWEPDSELTKQMEESTVFPKNDINPTLNNT
jgi:prevent-host-death family protein